MTKFVALSFLSVIGFLAQVGYGQEILVHPYVGGSLNFLGISDVGWGINAGVKSRIFYAGVEYGIYGSKTHTESLAAGETYHPTFENYFGAHGGVVIHRNVFLGLVLLKSYAHDVVGDVSSWFNIGPDFRWQAGPHFMFAAAYTMRRGFNAGIDFLF